MTIKDIMQKNVVTLSAESSVREAARLFRDKNVGCVLITNGQKLRGVLTDRDVACWLAEGKDPEKVNVGSIMQKDIITATPEMDTSEASRLLAENQIRRLPVIENGELCGIVSTADLAGAIEEEVDNFFKVEEAYRHIASA